jgi:hypothetical protein
MSPRTPLLTLPPDYPRIRVVHSFDELVATHFNEGINAVCWQRTLGGDFSEVAQRLQVSEGITTLDDARLTTLPLSPAGRDAVDVLLADLQRLRKLGLSPSLDCIRSYPRADVPAPVSTDVYSFHADSATIPTDTYLCSYTGAASEGIRNEDARRCVDVPSTRAELVKMYGGKDDDAFLEYLKENCFDLHYCALPEAQPFSFGLANLWRIAVEYPGSPVPACIHRAPETLPGQPPRLLLIS